MVDRLIRISKLFAIAAIAASLTVLPLALPTFTHVNLTSSLVIILSYTYTSAPLLALLGLLCGLAAASASNLKRAGPALPLGFLSLGFAIAAWIGLGAVAALQQH